MRKYAWLKEPLQSGDNIVYKIMLYETEEGFYLYTYDPLPFCQHDAFIPVRVKGRNVGKPEWGKFEVLQDGEWIEYNPER